MLVRDFASDRIKKLQYEFAHIDTRDQKRTDRINTLINGYAGCLDDAADSSKSESKSSRTFVRA